MGLLSRQVVAAVVALSWKRTVVVEQGHWRARRTAWKPTGTVRNLRAVHDTQLEFLGGHADGDGSLTSGRQVTAKQTNFEYEELEWRKYRSFSAKGDGTRDVHWPEIAVGPEQRISERRESYRARFASRDGEHEYVAELDEAEWKKLRIGRRCRLKVGAFSDEVKQVTRLLCPGQAWPGARPARLGGGYGPVSSSSGIGARLDP
jgi:hypothetical protein